MATTKGNKNRKLPSRPIVDTPIVVGGGGGGKRKARKYVYLEFDHNFFKKVPGTRKYLSQNDSLRRIKINGRAKNVQQSTWIKIYCVNPGVSEGEVTIFVDPLGLEFYSGPEDFPDNGRGGHRGENWEIRNVYSNGAGELYRYQAGSTDCTIEINTPARLGSKRTPRKTASKRKAAKTE